MLAREWNLEDALAVRFREGQQEAQEEIARKALAKGISLEVVSEIVGMDIEAIRRLSGQ
jgi:predicted transposase YdaD